MKNNPLQVLLIEDSTGDARLLREMFCKEKAGSFELTHLVRLGEAEIHLAKARADIILLDMGLPDGHGIETLRRTQAMAPGVPVIVLSGLDDEALAAQAMQEGAQDYLIKGQIENRALPRALRHAIERQRMLTETMTTSALQRAIFNSSNFSSIATDAKGIIQIFNVGAERMLGYAPDEVLNRLTPAELSDPRELILRAEALSIEFHTSIAPGFEALVYKASREIEDIYELTYIRKDGSRFPAMVSVTILRGNDGGAIGYLLIGTDNTARKQAEADKSALLRTIHLHSIVSVADRAGRIIEVNDSFCAISGYSREELLGRTHQIVNSGTHSPAFWVEMWQNIANGKSWRGEICNRSKDGSLYWVDSIIAPFMGEDGRTTKFVSIRTDVTAAKLSEGRLREAILKAEQASLAKSEFLANMSHEIRTPMNAILGMTHLALRAGLDSKQEGYLRKISDASHSLLNIINDILDFSKIEAGRLQLEDIPFSLAGLLNRVNDILASKAQQGNISLRLGVAEAVPGSLVGDPFRLEQILINLVSNAIKFSHEGKGTVTLAVTAEDVTANRGRINFSVRDTGIGMSPDQVSNLFQSFNQADSSFTRKYGGTGLGLAISKQLAELMGGTLSVESELGEGSTFCFSAIFDVPHSEVPETVFSRPSDPPPQRVLIVDDDESQVNDLALILRANGFNTRQVPSGEEALTVLAEASQAGEHFDLVLMDWRLPGISGLETARRIKEESALLDFPAVLMVSAYDREEAMGSGSAQAFDGFLIKPVKEALLMSQIAMILNKRVEKTLGSKSPDESAPPELTGRQVLLVEDNQINRDLATELLNDLGIHVTIAVNGQEGVDRVNSGLFDLVLMDIQMPVMDGLTATKVIRNDNRFHSLPIIAMTAHAMSSDRKRSLDSGMNDHLTKPINPDTLTKALLKWMPHKPVQRAEENLPLTGSVKDDDYLPETLAPFDIQAVLRRTNGKPRFVRKMMLSFRNQYAHAGTDLRQLIGEGKMEEAERFAHTLKGIARTLEAPELGDAAFAVENALRSGDVPYAEPLIERMEGMLAPAIVAAASLELNYPC
jgi:PAS domain S-box-containing protein